MSDTIREILFRGKRVENGKWVYGMPVETEAENGVEEFIISRAKWESDDNSIDFLETDVYEIDPETVGQYTGLTDRNSTKVFEGDIIAFEDETPGQYEYHDSLFINRGVIRFDDGQFYFTNSIAATMDDLLYKGTLDCDTKL